MGEPEVEKQVEEKLEPEVEKPEVEKLEPEKIIEEGKEVYLEEGKKINAVGC